MLRTRERLVESGPSLENILQVLGDAHPRTPTGWGAALAAAFHSSLPPLSGLDRHKKAFWEFVGRFALVTHFGEHRVARRAGQLLCFVWTEREGFAVGPKLGIRGEQLLDLLWGEIVPLRTDLASVARFDNATTRSLCRGNSLRHVLLGPLAFVNHTCAAHANLVPHNSTIQEAVNPLTGMRPTDYRMATTQGDIPANSLFGYEYAEAPDDSPAATATSFGED